MIFTGGFLVESDAVSTHLDGVSENCILAHKIAEIRNLSRIIKDSTDGHEVLRASQTRELRLEALFDFIHDNAIQIEPGQALSSNVIALHP